MKTPILFIFLLAIHLSFDLKAQCVEYEQMSALFGKDLDQQNTLMEKIGYKMVEGLKTENSIEWYNADSKQYINVSYYTATPQIKMIRYMMIGNKDCYQNLEENIKQKGFEKDTEMVKNSSLHFYYVSEKNGAVLYKIPEDGFVNHIFELYDVDSYYRLF